MGEDGKRSHYPTVERLEIGGAMRDNASPQIFAPARKVYPVKASEVCAKAAELIGGDREKQHGEKSRNFGNIARLWAAYLASRALRAEPLDALDVAHMMILMKVARTQTGELNLDDYVDAAGYAGCAAQIAQELA